MGSRYRSHKKWLKMPDPITVRLDTTVLDRIAANLGTNTDRVVAMLANEVVGTAVSSFGESPSAPGDPPGVDTGALRASVQSEHTGTNQYTVSDGVEYGAFLEYGTPRMAARPWLGAAVFKMMQTFSKRWEGLFK